MSQLIISETEEQPTFHRFQLVWAKILGWPWWPARITQIPSEKNGNYKVQFFADTSHAFLPGEKLTSFIQGRDRHSTPKGHYRNFVKALGLANKLSQSISTTQDELQSDCSSREKVVVQQIQIINYSQQAKIEPKSSSSKIQQENQIPEESIVKPQTIRKPKNSFRRLERSLVKHNSQMHLKLNEQVTEMLKKYKLDQISQQHKRKKCSKLMKKRKLISKNAIEYQNNEIVAGKLAKMIFKALSAKKIVLQQKYKITLTLKDSFFKNKEKGVEGIHTALFQWIRCSDSQTILQNYNSWPTDIKCDPFTDYS